MQPETQPQNQQSGGWQFVPEQPITNGVQPSQSSAPSTPDTHIAWTASEFIAYQKGAGWYLAAVAVLVCIAAIVYLITRDLISTSAIFITGVLFIGLAARKPRVLNYEISDQGIKIGEKTYLFSTLKSFAVIEEESMRSIDLLPLQRFMPAISMYYEPQDEATIVEALGMYLPKEERKQPMIDKLMHRIRF